MSGIPGEEDDDGEFTFCVVFVTFFRAFSKTNKTWGSPSSNSPTLVWPSVCSCCDKVLTNVILGQTLQPPLVLLLYLLLLRRTHHPQMQLGLGLLLIWSLDLVDFQCLHSLVDPLHFLLGEDLHLHLAPHPSLHHPYRLTNLTQPRPRMPRQHNQFNHCFQFLVAKVLSPHPLTIHWKRPLRLLRHKKIRLYWCMMNQIYLWYVTTGTALSNPFTKHICITT